MIRLSKKNKKKLLLREFKFVDPSEIKVSIPIDVIERIVLVGLPTKIAKGYDAGLITCVIW